MDVLRFATAASYASADIGRRIKACVHWKIQGSNNARVGVGCNRLKRTATEHAILLTKLNATATEYAMHCYRACICNAGSALKIVTILSYDRCYRALIYFA